MPLIRDEEFSEELSKAQAEVQSGWDTSRFVSLITTAIVIVFLFWIESDGIKLIAELLALAILVLVYKIDKGVKDIFVATMQCGFVIEWIGRKQLKEHERVRES